MRVFNNTDVPLDVRDRVILPGLGIDLPSVTDQVLTPDERRAFKLGALGRTAGGTRVPVLKKARHRRTIFSLPALLELL